jgi:hypothetical protein
MPPDEGSALRVWSDQTKESAPPVTIEFPHRTLTMVQVTTDELDSLASPGNGVNLALAGVAFGTVVTVASTLATVTITSPVTSGAFWGLAFASGIATVFFSVRAGLDYRTASKKIDAIKRGRAEPR